MEDCVCQFFDHSSTHAAGNSSTKPLITISYDCKEKGL